MYKLFLVSKNFLINFLLLILKNLFIAFTYFWFYVLFNQIFNSNSFTDFNAGFSAGFIVLFSLISFILGYLAKYFYKKHIAKITLMMFNVLTKNICKLHPKEFAQKSTQEHLFKIYEIPKQISDYNFSATYLIIDDILKFVFLISFLFYLNWVIALVVLVLSILVILFSYKLASKMTDLYYTNIEISEKNRYEIEFYFNNFFTYYYANKIGTWFNFLKNHYHKSQKQVYQNEAKINWLFLGYTSFLMFASFIPILIGAIFLFFNLFAINVATFLVIISYAFIWIFNVVDLGRTVPTIIQGTKILKENPINFLKQKTNLSFQKIDEIEINSLTFDFEQKPIFNNLNLKLKPKSKNAIIGKSGSGKSTLLKLMLNYYPDYQGSIKLSGTEVKELSNDELINNINYLGSINQIMNGSIKDNITLWSEKYDLNELKKIIDLVGLSSLDLDQEINFSENNLSEGQIQRILLARTIYNKKPVLILDEAYNNIDQKTTKKIRQYFLEQNDLTYLEVSHHFDQKTLDQFETILEL